MQSLTKQNKIIVGVILAFLVVLIYYMALLKPSLDSISTINSQITSANNNLNDIKQKVDNNNRDLAKFNQYGKMYNNSLAQIPVQLKDPEISDELNNLATAKQLKVTNLTIGKTAAIDDNLIIDINALNKKPTEVSAALKTSSKPSNGTAKANSDIQETQVQLTVTGDYTKIIEYTNALENNKAKNDKLQESSKKGETLKDDTRACFVTTYTIAGSSDDKSKGTQTCQISLVYFYATKAATDAKIAPNIILDYPKIDTSSTTGRTDLFK